MTSENQGTASANLRLIREVMEGSRTLTAERGDGFILWGVIILLGFLACLLEYLEIFRLPNAAIWTSLVLLGWILTLWLSRRRETALTASPFSAKLIDEIWISVLVCMTILGFLGSISGVIHPEKLSGILFSVLGIAYWLQGLLMQRSWVKMLALGWWTGSIACFFAPPLLELILGILMMAGLQIVPGILFRREWNRMHAGLNE